MLRVLLDLIVPPACLACGAPGRALCGPCRRMLEHLEAPCPRCALPAPCGTPCPARAAPWERAWAPVAYAGPARALVGALKFHGHTAAAAAMAASIAATAPPGVLTADAVLVPVPTSRARVRERGFDQAELLAAALGRRCGLRVANGLERVGDRAARQVGATRAAREAAASASVRARGRAPAPTCVLVDDVHTTGATLRAAARALRGAGAERVVAVTYARTL